MSVCITNHIYVCAYQRIGRLVNLIIVVNFIQKDFNVHHKYGNLILAITHLRDWMINLQHILREGNTSALSVIVFFQCYPNFFLSITHKHEAYLPKHVLFIICLRVESSAQIQMSSQSCLKWSQKMSSELGSMNEYYRLWYTI
jgi:hypothetical protein